MREVFQKKRNWVLIGESGCGKTEVSMYLAKKLKAETDKKISLIDMDQTKGMFRSRDFTEQLAQEGIKVTAGPHFMDMPVVPHGMERLLEDTERINILDVGGNEIGAVTLGQFSKRLNDMDGAVLYLVNPYRNFSGTAENIRMLMRGIQAAGRIETVHIIANPNLGPGTTAEDILEGYEKLTELLTSLEFSAEALVIPDWAEAEAFSQLPLPKWIITPYIKYP